MTIDNIMLAPKFVDYLPNGIDEGIVYISIRFATASHKCACGCGEEVVTPLSPTGWKLIFDGESVSLSPSIGNWGFACRSHYWIKKNQVVWDQDWSEDMVRRGRAYDQSLKSTYYSQSDEPLVILKRGEDKENLSLWSRLMKMFMF